MQIIKKTHFIIIMAATITWKEKLFNFSKTGLYLLIIFLMLISTALRIWPLQWGASHLIYMTYYPIVIIASVMGGLRVGLLSTILICCCILVFWPFAINNYPDPTPLDVSGMLFFIFNSTLIAVLAEALRQTNAQYKKEQEKLVFTLSASQQGYWDLNLTTCFIDATAIYYRILGHTQLKTNWTLEDFFQLIHEEDRGAIRALYEAAITEKKTWEFECRIRVKDTMVRWIWGVGAHSHFDTSSHMLGMIRDITLRKNQEMNLKNMTAKYNALLDATPDAMIITDEQGNIIFANALAERLFGYSIQELLGQAVEMLIPARFMARHKKHRQKYMHHPAPRYFGSDLELVGKNKDGHEFSVELSLSPLKTDEGWFVLASIRDVSERKKAEQIRAMLSAIVESSEDAIISENSEGIITSWNQGAERLYGYTSSEMIGNSIQLLLPEKSHHEFSTVIERIKRGETLKEKEVLRLHRDGHPIPVSVNTSPIKDAANRIIGASIISRDVSQEKSVKEKLQHLAEHDALTGLINRTIFEDRLEQGLALSSQQHTMMAVFFIDIDNFKLVNDQYGHTMGDNLLIAVTKRMQMCIRDIDSLARFGGDEFAIIILNLKNEHEIEKVAKKILHMIRSEPFTIDTITLSITISMGISVFPKDGHKSLLEKADTAMYFVKHHQKNNYKFFEPAVTE